VISIERTFRFHCVHGLVDGTEEELIQCPSSLLVTGGDHAEEESALNDAVSDAAGKGWKIAQADDYGFETAVAFCPKHANCEQAEDDEESGYARVWELFDQVGSEKAWECKCPPEADPNQLLLDLPLGGE
jgi:hypothetical protein